jgi:hypothetical protein
MSGPLVVVAGALANKPLNGGEAWVRMSWVRGLQRLGCRVWFLEEIDDAVCTDLDGASTSFERSINRDWFFSVISRFGLESASSLLRGQGGVAVDEARDVVASADLLINISGNLADRPARDRCRRSAYVDLDPGFTQIWHEQGNLGARLAGHDLYFSVGMNVGSARCKLPTGGFEWRPMLPPVVLEEWPASTAANDGRFTTVATWRGPYGPVEWDRRRLGLKVHEFRKYLSLPGLVDAPFELALGIHPDDGADLEQLLAQGWAVVDPRQVAGTPDEFRHYVAGSMAEFSVAQEVYVASRSGWFSDRTTRYLASGRPVLVQDTGFGDVLPTGKGLLTFSNIDEAKAGAESILSDYAAHALAARSVAEEFLDSDALLGSFLETCLA